MERGNEGEITFVPCLICALLMPTLPTPETGPEVGAEEAMTTALVGAATMAPTGAPP